MNIFFFCFLLVGEKVQNEKTVLQDAILIRILGYSDVLHFGFLI